MNFFDLTLQLEAVAILTIISLASLRFKILDSKGVMASIVVGYLIMVFAGLSYFAILLAFFLVSAAVTRLRVRIVGESFVEKDWIRSWKNVLANGLAPTLAIILPTAFRGGSTTMAIGYLGAVGTAFADTLATEIGLLYGGRPRLITSFEKVEKGTPGAVSFHGYLGGLLALAILSGLAPIIGLASPSTALIIISSGIFGMTIDSVLGAGVQAKYRCQVCGKIVENGFHCGQPAGKISGIRWINTHVVNLISTSMGAVLAIIFLQIA